jgi:hypothetical protein
MDSTRRHLCVITNDQHRRGERGDSWNVGRRPRFGGNSSANCSAVTAITMMDPANFDAGMILCQTSLTPPKSRVNEHFPRHSANEVRRAIIRRQGRISWVPRLDTIRTFEPKVEIIFPRRFFTALLQPQGFSIRNFRRQIRLAEKPNRSIFLDERFFVGVL